MALQDDYRDYLRSTLERRQIPGASVFLRRNEQILFDEGVGLADRENGRPVTPETIFGIGSVTKSFTAVSIMQLVDAGKLSVSDRLSEHLPQLERSGDTDLSGITLHHLLTNSSGLPPLSFLDAAMGTSYRAEASKEWLKIDVEKLPEPIDTAAGLIEAMAAADIELHAAPGERFSYSNEGFALLGHIVEKVSGQKYTAFVNEHILKPLEMTRTLFDGKRLLQMGDVTELYSYINSYDRVEHTPGWWEAPSMTSAGFLRSTARDMGRYAALFFGDRPDLISPESLAAMMQPHVETGGDGRLYGYGLMVQPDYHGRKLVEHGGNIKGVAAYFTMFPAERVVSVVLNNLSGGPTGGMALAGANLAVGLPIDQPRVVHPEVDVQEAAINRMLGLFRSDEGTRIEFAASEDGSLTATSAMGDFAVTAVADDKLVIDANGSPATAYFLEPGDEGYEAVFFGFRILKRVDLAAEAEEDSDAAA